MGMLGQYLKEAREAKGVDLHDAAQETRISIHFLKALEEEDFSRLPGEVFVRGFLKCYAQYLRLPDHEVLARYHELKPKAPPAAGSSSEGELKGPVCEQTPRTEMSLEPIIWGALLFIGLLIFLFTALPGGHDQTLPPCVAVPAAATPGTVAPEKSVGAPLYLKILAVDDVWVLIRTDASPQKKAVLKKGETITWSAESRFLLSFGKVGSVQLFLNERELTIEGPREAAVRDLMITSAGIETRTLRTEQVQKPKPPAPPQPKPAPAPSPTNGTAELPSPQAETKPPKPAPSPQAAPAEPKPLPTPSPDNL